MSEIARSRREVGNATIGERMPGLPKEPGPAKDTPFNELPHN